MDSWDICQHVLSDFFMHAYRGITFNMLTHSVIQDGVTGGTSPTGSQDIRGSPPSLAQDIDASLTLKVTQ